MARLLALDWDTTEARYVIASAHGARLKVEAAGTLPIDSEASGSQSQLGEALRTAVGGKAGRATAIVGVDRSQIELVLLTLPPAPDVELPELVRNQAVRENSAIADDAVLDFVAASQDATEPRAVTAAALSRVGLERIQAVLSDAGVVAKAIVLRPYATAGLVLDSLENRDLPCLVINVLAEEADLIVLSEGKVVFWRTLRHSNAPHEAAAAQRLLVEIQRTLVVAQTHLSGRTVEAAYLCGGLDEHPALIEALRGNSSLELTLLDPLATHGGLPNPPDNAGRFASLLGMLAMEAQGAGHAIDFLHPRKRPAPPDRRRTFVLAGAAAALVVLLGGYHAWSTFAEVDKNIESLSAELDGLDEQFKRADQKQKVIQAIGDWAQNDVNWLDELRDLSLRFPSSRDAVVLRMGLSHGRDSGGTIDMVGIVRDPVIVSHIENNLRDEFHQISSRHEKERLQEDDYTWHFESKIVVTPRKAGQYVSHLPEGTRPIEQSGDKANPAPDDASRRSAAKER